MEENVDSKYKPEQYEINSEKMLYYIFFVNEK